MQLSQKAKLQIIVSTFFVLVFGGTILFRWLEDFTWIQAFYFSVTTMTTVGYGDLVPTNDLTRLVVACYILVAVTMYVSLATYIGVYYLERQEKKRLKNHPTDAE